MYALVSFVTCTHCIEVRRAKLQWDTAKLLCSMNIVLILQYELSKLRSVSINEEKHKKQFSINIYDLSVDNGDWAKAEILLLLNDFNHFEQSCLTNK